jgi:hypothetical protein
MLATVQFRILYLLSKNVKMKTNRTISLSFVFMSMKLRHLREEHRLREFENKELRRICGPERDGVTGGLRKLHSEELHNLCSSDVIRMIKSRWTRWAGHEACVGEVVNA